MRKRTQRFLSVACSLSYYILYIYRVYQTVKPEKIYKRITAGQMAVGCMTVLSSRYDLHRKLGVYSYD